MIFLIMEVHRDQLSVLILIQNTVLHPRHINEMTTCLFPPLGGSLLTTWSFWRGSTVADMWRLKHQFQFTFFSSHRLFCTLLPSLFLSHYLFAYPSLSLPRSLSLSSSLCLCSNLAVSHLVIVVPKSHFLGRNTLAEGCSAITCRITRLSLTISWETGDNGLPWTRPSWQLAPSQTLTQRV